MPAAGLLRLEPIASWTGYNAPVKGVVIDETRNQVVSTSQNGSLVLHSFDGRELSRQGLICPDRPVIHTPLLCGSPYRPGCPAGSLCASRTVCMELAKIWLAGQSHHCVRLKRALAQD